MVGAKDSALHHIDASRLNVSCHVSRNIYMEVFVRIQSKGRRRIEEIKQWQYWRQLVDDFDE